MTEHSDSVTYWQGYLFNKLKPSQPNTSDPPDLAWLKLSIASKEALYTLGLISKLNFEYFIADEHNSDSLPYPIGTLLDAIVDTDLLRKHDFQGVNTLFQHTTEPFQQVAQNWQYKKRGQLLRNEFFDKISPLEKRLKSTSPRLYGILMKIEHFYTKPALIAIMFDLNCIKHLLHFSSRNFWIKTNK